MTNDYEIEIYSSGDAREPFSEWLDSLKDKKIKNAVLLRIQRLRQGNFGDHKIFDKILELRIHYGPGIRIYCSKIGPKLVLLLGGGAKGTQDRDIKKCKDYLADYIKGENS